MEFKRQTNRSTRQDRTDNINIFLKGFSFGVVTSNYWGSFNERDKDYKEIEKSHKPHDSNNPLIEIDLDNKQYELTLEEFKNLLKSGLKEKLPAVLNNKGFKIAQKRKKEFEDYQNYQKKKH